MAQPAGDERTARPEAVERGRAFRTIARPYHPADIAEDQARRAVEGRGIAPRRRRARHRREQAPTDARPE